MNTLRLFSGAIYLLIFLVFTVLCGSDSLTDTRTDEEVDGYCLKTDEGESCGNKNAEIHLTRLEGGEIGSTQIIKVNGEVEFHVKTLSKKPLILEVPNFLIPAECQHLIELAKKEGLQKSITEPTGREKAKTFQLMDRDSDKRLNLSEMFETLQNSFDIYLEEEDLKEIFVVDKTYPEQFQQAVSKLNLPIGRKQLKLLGGLIRVVLTEPHSNSDIERTIFILRKIQADSRGNLDPVTIHHLLSVEINNDKD